MLKVYVGFKVWVIKIIWKKLSLKKNFFEFFYLKVLKFLLLFLFIFELSLFFQNFPPKNYQFAKLYQHKIFLKKNIG